jgi:endonuclease/exonuclease/phosphatase family metal-dependent hydrolase
VNDERAGAANGCRKAGTASDGTVRRYATERPPSATVSAVSTEREGSRRPDAASITVLTWNVQGSDDLDIAAVAAIVRPAAPDVIALQEVQRRQARRLAEVLAVAEQRWAWKHWPLIHRAEGLAVLTVHRTTAVESFPIRHRPFWDHRRRIGIDVTVDTGHTVGRVINVHLSAHGDESVRAAEAHLIVSRAETAVPAPIIVGDLNDCPRAGAHAALMGAGWIDAWQHVHGDADGSTNWTPGERRGRAPTQRLDYVLAPSGSVIERALVFAEFEGIGDMGRLSDHLPLVATVRLPEIGMVHG